MMTVDRRQEFESALASRDLMGQAKGILMNRFSVDAVRAFEMMVQQSQTTNTPVRIIARQIVDIYTGGSTPSVAQHRRTQPDSLNWSWLIATSQYERLGWFRLHPAHGVAFREATGFGQVASVLDCSMSFTPVC